MRYRASRGIGAMACVAALLVQTGATGAVVPPTGRELRYWFAPPPSGHGGPAASPAASRCPDPLAPDTDMSGMYAFYGKEKTQSVIDPAKLQSLVHRFQNTLREKAVLLQQEKNGFATATAATDASACIIRHLSAWARADALNQKMADNDPLGHRQAVLTQAWTGLAFANAYRIALALGPVTGQDRADIDGWFQRLSASIAEEFGPHGVRPKQWQWLDAQANHRFWGAATTAAFASFAGDRQSFDAGMAELPQALATAAPDGGLPSELWRGVRALHYQCFALYAIAILVAEADANHVVLSQAEETALQAVARFTLGGLQDPATIQTKTGYQQVVKPEDWIWIEILIPHFQKTAPTLARTLDDAAAPRRPIEDGFTGLPATLLLHP